MISFALLWSILFDANCILFTAAFILLMLSFVVEVLGFLIAGTGIFSFLDGLTPDIDSDVEDHFTMNIFAWAKHKNVPVSIWVAIGLCVFSVLGLLIQVLAQKYLGHTINMFIVSIVSAIPAILVAKIMTYNLGKTIFIDETIAVEINDLVGLPAAITIGVAKKSNPAQCKINDKFGKPHYLMCVPLSDNEEYTRGDSLKVVKINGNLAIVDKDM
jgi:hypothetical protein